MLTYTVNKLKSCDNKPKSNSNIFFHSLPNKVIINNQELIEMLKSMFLMMNAQSILKIKQFIRNLIIIKSLSL